MLCDGHAGLSRRLAEAVVAGPSPRGGLEVTLRQLIHVPVDLGATTSSEVGEHDREARARGRRVAALTMRSAAP